MLSFYRIFYDELLIHLSDSNFQKPEQKPEIDNSKTTLNFCAFFTSHNSIRMLLITQRIYIKL